MATCLFVLRLKTDPYDLPLVWLRVTMPRFHFRRDRRPLGEVIALPGVISVSVNASIRESRGAQVAAQAGWEFVLGNTVRSPVLLAVRELTTGCEVGEEDDDAAAR